MKKLIEQMIKFGFVGFLCFFIDWGIMVFLTEVFGINPLISSTISFTVSVTVNYILSVTFVFETDNLCPAEYCRTGSERTVYVAGNRSSRYPLYDHQSRCDRSGDGV